MGNQITVKVDDILNINTDKRQDNDERNKAETNPLLSEVSVTSDGKNIDNRFISALTGKIAASDLAKRREKFSSSKKNSFDDSFFTTNTSSNSSNSSNNNNNSNSRAPFQQGDDTIYRDSVSSNNTSSSRSQSLTTSETRHDLATRMFRDNTASTLRSIDRYDDVSDIDRRENLFQTFLNSQPQECVKEFTADKDFWLQCLVFCEFDSLMSLNELVADRPIDNRLHSFRLLVWAVRRNSVAVVRSLFERYWPEDAKENDIAVILGEVMRTKRDTVAKLMYLIVDWGFDPYVSDALPICYCIKYGGKGNELLRTLIDDCGVEPRGAALHVAIKCNNMQAAMFLLERGVKAEKMLLDPSGHLNYYTTHYATLLRHVTSQGRPDFMQTLLAAINNCSPDSMNAIINAKNEEHKSCLLIAVEYGTSERRRGESDDDVDRRTEQSRDMVDLLLDHGACVMSTNRNNETSLHVAVRVDNVKAAGVLRRHRMYEEQMAARDRTDLTPLLTSAAHGTHKCFNSIAPLMLAKRHHFTVSDKRQRTIVHLAVENVSTGQHVYDVPGVIEQTFLKQVLRADPDCLDRQDCDGNTPLDLATARQDGGIVDMLLRRADPTDKTRCSSFLKAASRGKLETCQMILQVTNSTCLRSPDSEGNSGLHLAALNGHLDIVIYLASTVTDNVFHKFLKYLSVTTYYLAYYQNHNEQTPLHLAAAEGQLEVVRYLIRDRPGEERVNQVDSVGLTPLHYAAMNNRVDVVQLLLQQRGCVAKRDILGRNVLDVAIDGGCYEVCCAILRADKKQRYEALENEIYYDDDNIVHPELLSEEQLALLRISELPKVKCKHTPLRRMIEKMPDLASFLFELCTTHETDRIVYDVEFLCDSGRREGRRNRMCEKDNHPLTLMIRNNRVDLLHHPLVTALIYQKSKVPLTLYLMFVLMYILLVSSITAYVTCFDMPPSVNWTACEAGIVYIDSEIHTRRMLFRISTWLFIIVGINVEIVQMCTIKKRYLGEWHHLLTNTLDWFCYVSMILVTYDFSECGALTEWQWQLSAFCILGSWVNVVILLSRIPSCGIYVIMLMQVAKTFLKFFIILFFSLLAFSFAFYVLLQNQTAFSSPLDAVVKTAVMITGDQNFDEIFYSYVHSDEYPDQIFYKKSTYVVYILFLVSVAIVVLNLLVGLAVGDISTLTRSAKFERLKLTVDLMLDVELQNEPKYLRLRTVYETKSKAGDSDFEQQAGLMTALVKGLKTALFYDTKRPELCEFGQLTKKIKEHATAERIMFKKEVSEENQQLRRTMGEKMLAETNQLKEHIKQFKTDISEQVLYETGRLRDEMSLLRSEMRQILQALNKIPTTD
jgi:ankyrin repeat protein